jgi:hypothetical protein
LAFFAIMYQFVPAVIHRGCGYRGFGCLASDVMYSAFQMLKFGFAGNGTVEPERRQDQVGPGVEVATSIASCG